MYFDFSKGVKRHKLYYFGKPTANILSYLVYSKMIVKGKDNIPKDGAFIIASNHIAFSDPAIIVAHCPRTVHFMAKSELFENYFYAAFVRNMNAFPVIRNHSDRNALRYAKDIINKGWVLGIFPEGQRVRKSSPTEAKPGVAYLARVTGADVLPVCLYRAPDDDGRRHGITLVYGKMIKNSDLGFEGRNRNEELARASKIIMDRIKDLWEAENENHSS